VTLLLPRAILREIRQHVEDGYPNEVCGFLIGDWDGKGSERAAKRVRRAPNTVEGSKRTRFVIHPRELIALEDELEGSGQQILGFYHSHPDYPAAPSRFDEEHAWPWYSYIVASVVNGKFGHATSWILREDRSTFDEETLVVK